MIKKVPSKKIRQKKHWRIRQKLSGTAETPRLSVYRSLNNIYAQIIDDTTSKTLVSASSLELGGGGNADMAAKVGEAVAKKALEKDIKDVVFDRGGLVYHGRIKALADAAREAGLNF